ncbi:MAG TPA: flotillin domain-containing protein, partial [Candidatus Dormibacteraeota bacterium]
AQAAADQVATQKEQEAEALKAQARRDSAIKQAGYQAEIDQASAVSKQAGPLSEATARQKVVVEETKVAELEAQRAEQQLQVEVRKPADAKAYERTTLAKADRDSQILAAEAAAQRVKLEAIAAAEQTKIIGEAEAHATRAKGLAEGEAVKAKGLAEADAIKARAEALAEHQEAVIGQQLAEQWPAIVEAAAKPFGSIDQLIVLNGAEGISETLAQAVSQGAAGLQVARKLLSRQPESASNGTGRRKPAKRAAEETVSES